MVRSYSVNGGAGGTRFGAVSFSDEPAALITRLLAPNGVLLKDGNTEPAYGVPPAGSVGGPLNVVALPCARIVVPCGIEPIRNTIWPSGGGCSGG